MTSHSQQTSNQSLDQLFVVFREVYPPPKPFIGCSWSPRFLQKPEKEITKAMVCHIDCDEVYPSIFIGDEATARSTEFLHAVEITHVLNTAEGNNFGQVSTGKQYYHSTGIVDYMGFNIIDIPQAPIQKYFEQGSDFIQSAINSGGRVLVHCLMGLSRSSTIVLAYLILKKSMTAEEALRTIRKQRDIRPNDGFLKQLLELENKVKSQSIT